MRWGEKRVCARWIAALIDSHNEVDLYWGLESSAIKGRRLAGACDRSCGAVGLRLTECCRCNEAGQEREPWGEGGRKCHA